MDPSDLITMPADSDGWVDWIQERGNASLRDAADRIAALKTAPSGDSAILQLWNDAAISIRNATAASGLLSVVHPQAEVIELAEQIEIEVERFSHDLLLDREVFDQLLSVRQDPLDDGALRAVRDALRSFRRAGVDRDEEVRARLRELNDLETELTQSFSRNIRDGRRTARVPVSALAGLPADYIADHPVDDAGSVAITTEYPDLTPFLTYSRDVDARRALAHEHFNRAWPENDAVLGQLLRTREEQAQLLGYPDWPSFDAEIKMIGSGPAIIAFIDRVAADSLAAGRRDLEILQERARREGVEAIDLASWRYYYETVKREECGVDAQQVRQYFDFAKVLQGLLDVTGRLFDLRYEPVDVPTWHTDVASYEVYLGDDLLGRIHLDLHPRDRKYNHAAQFDLVPGVRGRQLPEGVLVCNFSRGLMDHDEVVTLFHEFGHLMHHVLAGRHEWVRFSGVATEWDFVEAPSQMLEEWAWNVEVLQMFATDASGSPIPTELVTAMRAADEFCKALMARTQMFYSALSYCIHQEVPTDLTSRLFELYAEYSLVEPLEGTHFHAGFGHLADYTSAYYTYFWSLVIAKDMFSAFDPDEPFAPGPALRYRDAVLAPGGSADAAALVADFLGRPYNTEAFTAWLDR